ncbi:MAG: rhodanese-like domain-containing protein [Gammaproteobacteria bacterium]|nr:rhodanese-like domain-containing protein [Gammaproteobacteria bacterium]
MRYIFFLISIVLIPAACTVDQSDTASSNGSATTFTQPNEASEWRVQHVKAPAAQRLITDQPNIIVLDVRTSKEYSAGHISDSKNIDFYQEDFADKLSQLDKSAVYLLHCKSGGRSSKALKVMEDLGFENVYHLDGGFDAWKEAGLAAAA